MECGMHHDITSQTGLTQLRFALSAPKGIRKYSLCSNFISSSDECRADFRFPGASLSQALEKDQDQDQIREKGRRETDAFFLKCFSIEKLPWRLIYLSKIDNRHNRMENTMYNIIIVQTEKKYNIQKYEEGYRNLC